MLTEDYLIRMINLAIAALLRIVGLKSAGRYREASEAIDQLLEELLGLRASLIKQLDDGKLLAALTLQDNLDTNRLLIIADLFKEQGDIYAAQGIPGESYWSYLRALNFYLEVELNGGAAHFPAPDDKIEGLIEILQEQRLPPETLYTMFNYYEQTGSYARGEAVLKRLTETGSSQMDIEANAIRPDAIEPDAAREELEAYYLRLLEKPETELVRGGLSRAQVEGSLARIREN